MQPKSAPLGRLRPGLCGAQTSMQGEASVTPSLLTQAAGNKGPRAGHKITVRVFSNSQFNVFSNKTKGRNTWCFFSKQSLGLKINQCVGWVSARSGFRSGQGSGGEGTGGPSRKPLPRASAFAPWRQSFGRAAPRGHGLWLSSGHEEHLGCPEGRVTAGTRRDVQ